MVYVIIWKEYINYFIKEMKLNKLKDLIIKKQFYHKLMIKSTGEEIEYI